MVSFEAVAWGCEIVVWGGRLEEKGGRETYTISVVVGISGTGRDKRGKIEESVGNIV